MNSIIDAAFSRARTVVSIFLVFLLAGTLAYQTIPKEAEPDIPIPIIYVSSTLDGISPEDAERLLVKPIEKVLQTIEGVKEIRSTASEGRASVVLEFNAGFDNEQALADVEEEVDAIENDLPPDATTKVVEINLALFPVVTLLLSGDVPDRALNQLAKRLQDEIESLPPVLEVELSGYRDEVVEAVVDSSTIEAYGLSLLEVGNLIRSNNLLVAPGALDSGVGRMVLKVPGVVESIEDMYDMPIKVDGNRVLTVGDVAEIRRTFVDPQGFARLNGTRSLALEVKKRSGANIIETIGMVRVLAERAQELPEWPEGVTVTFQQDKSEQIKTMLSDLENNVVTAIVLVMIVIILAMGWRPSLLVGLSIPGSFLAAMVILQALGFTLNIVVLFSLILVVGMLVDGAIVTVELAERRLAAGDSPREAFSAAAKRMTWPIIASTATTLMVFMPLTVWPGIVGEFMKYLPMTAIVTLACALFMALIFVPVLGMVLSRKRKKELKPDIAESGNLDSLSGPAGGYYKTLAFMVRHPAKVLFLALVGIGSTYAAYGAFGKGVEFFPAIEPEFLQVQVQARGDLSVRERDDLVMRVEDQVLGTSGLESVYSRTLNPAAVDDQLPVGTIGVIQIELADWQERRKAELIIEELREKTAKVPGIQVQVRKQEGGPGAGKPIDIQVAGNNLDRLDKAVEQILTMMGSVEGIEDIEDSRALPSIEWQVDVDRKRAAQYGANVGLLGNSIKMVTSGVVLTEYRPDDTDEELEIRLRFPPEQRSLDELSRLRVPTALGSVPASNFIQITPQQKTGNIERVDSTRVLTIQAGVEEGLLADDVIGQLKELIAQSSFPAGVEVNFKGQDADQQEAMSFLGGAFVTALFLMTLILVTQFNSFYQAGLVMSAIVFSTAGVFLGLMITAQPFGIVMCGIGVISLAGIVVNNNIVLIDTYNGMRKQNVAPMEAILRTSVQRARPVLLTSITTILGLMPMVFALTIKIFEMEVLVGAPSSQWWTQLSSTIAGGMAFATLLTLFLTPCLLMLRENLRRNKAPEGVTLSAGVKV